MLGVVVALLWLPCRENRSSPSTGRPPRDRRIPGAAALVCQSLDASPPLASAILDKFPQWLAITHSKISWLTLGKAGIGEIVLKRPCIIRCLVLLLAFAFLGQGRVGQGLQLFLFADQHACCKTKQHCSISYGKKTRTHSSHSPNCPHAHQKSRTSFQCALQTCHPSGPDGLVSAQSLRFVLTQSVGLPGPLPERRFYFSQPLRSAELAIVPPTPPPRSPRLV